MTSKKSWHQQIFPSEVFVEELSFVFEINQNDGRN